MKSINKPFVLFLLLVLVSGCKEEDNPSNGGGVVIDKLPSNLQEGINIVDNSTVTWVLYDKDKQGVSYDAAYIVGDFND